jgi:hypothetical protein
MLQKLCNGGLESCAMGLNGGKVAAAAAEANLFWN